MELLNLTAVKLAEKIKAGEVSAVDAVQAVLSQIEKT